MTAILTLTYENKGAFGVKEAGPNISFACRYLKRLGLAGGRMGSSGFETMNDWLSKQVLIVRIADGYYFCPPHAKSELINQWSAENTRDLGAFLMPIGACSKPDAVVIEGFGANEVVLKELEDGCAFEAASVDELLGMLKPAAAPKKKGTPSEALAQMEESFASRARKQDEARHKSLQRSRAQGNKQTLEEVVAQMLAQPENLGAWA